MPFFTNIKGIASEVVNTLTDALYPSEEQQAQSLSAKTRQYKRRWLDGDDKSSKIDTPTKRRRTASLSTNNSLTATIDAKENTPSFLPDLPDDVLRRIFSFTPALKQKDLPQLNLREVSKRFSAVYDSMLYPKFLCTFQPTFYDATKYQLQVNQTDKPGKGKVHLALEGGALTYHLQTLEGQSLQGVLDIKVGSPLSRQAVFAHKEVIHQEISKAIRPEGPEKIKARLIEEMDKLLINKITILKRHPQSASLQRSFTRLAELRQAQLNQTWHLLESEHHIEQINTEIIFNDIKVSLHSGMARNLNCAYSCLTRFPKTILAQEELVEFWSKLISLNLSNNYLQSLPSEIKQLAALRRLDLEKNLLQSLPTQIGELRALEWLRLNNNKLQDLPTQIGQLAALKSLYLEYNYLRNLPAQIGGLTLLETLYVQWNQLQSLPSEIGKLAALKDLSCFKNELSNLPNEIGKLARLQVLGLERNQLDCLPVELEKLTALQKLYLAHNRLQCLPEGLRKNILYKRDRWNIETVVDEAKILTVQQPIDDVQSKRSVSLR